MKFLYITLFAFMLAACDDSSNDGDKSNDMQQTDDSDNDSMDGTDMDMHDTESMNDTDMMEKGYMDISPKEAMDMLSSEDNVVVIDVSPAYDDGHIKGALNFYVGDGTLDAALMKIDKSFTYIVYCHSDAASMLGADKFVAAGFENVYRIEGNYGAWVAAEFPTEATADGYMDISPQAAKVLIDATPMLMTIDVSPLYESGHLPGAMSYPLGDDSLANAIDMLDMSKPYLVYCHGDAPSIQGSEMLFDAGFQPVYRLEGNYGAWTAKGFPVE